MTFNWRNLKIIVMFVENTFKSIYLDVQDLPFSLCEHMLENVGMLESLFKTHFTNFAQNYHT